MQDENLNVNVTILNSGKSSKEEGEEFEGGGHHAGEKDGRSSAGSMGTGAL